jgi:hypothetical protein
MTENKYKPNTEKQTELACALIETIEDFREDLTEVEIIGALQLISWQRGMAMFGKYMLEDLMEDKDDD